MDLTPHLVTGAALAVRVKRPSVAIIFAIASHFFLDAIPHFHIAWGVGKVLFEVIDIGLGLLLTGVIACRAWQLWPFVGAVAAILPDAPGLREYWGMPANKIFPHPMWLPPWGVATQVAVVGVALLWAFGSPRRSSELSPRRIPPQSRQPSRRDATDQR